MRSCLSCARENPVELDFCDCGEPLRWEPTGGFPAVRTVVNSKALSPFVDSVHRNRTRIETLVESPAAKVTITLRLPDRDADKDSTLKTSVEPGQRERVLALRLVPRSDPQGARSLQLSGDNPAFQSLMLGP